MSKSTLACLFWIVIILALIDLAHGYATIIRVDVYAPSSVRVNEEVVVQAIIHTGNNRIETVYDVQAALILPDGVNLTSGINPVYIGNMGPGPSRASCNWTVVFANLGIYLLSVNSSCIDTQHVPRWKNGSTMVEVYGPPHAQFTYSFNLYVNQTVTFNASASEARGPEGDIVSYQWDFGDGTNLTTDNPVVDQKFLNVGNYTVSLNVTDNRGLSSDITIQLGISLFGDINLDKTVNIIDITIVSHSFGSYLGDERWKTECDLNNDEVIDIRDITIVALEFGKTV